MNSQIEGVKLYDLANGRHILESSSSSVTSNHIDYLPMRKDTEDNMW